MIGVTGASGKLGALVAEGLLKLVPAQDIVAILRSPRKGAGFAARGVRVRHGDYSMPETLAPALAGIERLLLVSGSEAGRRTAQHRAVIEAAKVAGVRLIAYTSVLRADTTTLPIAAEHRETEALLRDSDLAYVLLRNGWYIENYTERLAMPLAMGSFIGAAGEGRIAAATRADYAAAAIRVLTTEGQDGKTYELAGDHPFTMTDLAASVSEWAGRALPYNDMPAAQYRDELVKAGVPDMFVKIAVDADVAISHGDLDSNSRDLQGLMGRESETLRDVLARLHQPVKARRAMPSWSGKIAVVTGAASTVIILTAPAGGGGARRGRRH
jgi:NAD(P)H dehydrogenase (quinone)